MQPVGMGRQRGNSGAKPELSQQPCSQENSVETLWGGEISLMTLCERVGEHHLQVGNREGVWELVCLVSLMVWKVTIV